jgi:hypothetical protein
MGGILVQPQVSHIHCTWTEGNIQPPELIEIIANKNASEVLEDDQNEEGDLEEIYIDVIFEEDFE